MGKTDAEYIAELEEMFDANREAKENYKGKGNEPRDWGTLTSPTRYGLLAIAGQGKASWNAWANQHPTVSADFSENNPSSLKKIDFRGFYFRGDAIFRGVHLTDQNDFSGCVFFGKAVFDGATFQREATFANAEFQAEARFSGTTFEKGADFSSCEFGEESTLIFSPKEAKGSAKLTGPGGNGFVEFNSDAIFEGAWFDGGIEFGRVKFKKQAAFRLTTGEKVPANVDFRDCIFESDADFTAMKFAKANFSDTVFKRACRFNESEFTDSARFDRVVFVGAPEFSKKVPPGSGKQTFHEIEFSGCWFLRGAIFKSREFLTTASFCATETTKGREPGSILALIPDDDRDEQIEHAREFLSKFRFKKHHRIIAFAEKWQLIPVYGDKTVFLGIPDFHGCKFHQDTSFFGTEFEVPPGDDAARAFRTLKLAMEGLKSIHEEQMFFRLEMAADRPTLPRPRRWISSIYRATSVYGYSLLHPLMTLAVATLVLGATHGLLTNLYHVTALTPDIFDFDSERTSRWFRYVLINTIPAPGFDKTQMDLRIELFGKDGHISNVATLFEMLHKVVSLGCVFLVGLALRNLFKMKS